MAVMKETSKRVLRFLQQHSNEDYTAKEVADALGLEKRSVDGSFTSFQNKDIGYRLEVERENEDGTHSKVKLLKLTENGLTFDPDNQPK